LKFSIVVSLQETTFKALTYMGNFEDYVKSITRYGYNGIELAIRDPQIININKIKSIIENHGIEVPAIGTGQAWSEEGLSFTSNNKEIRRRAIKRIKHLIPMAAHLHAIIIIGLIRGITPKELDRPQAIDYMTDAIRECAEEAISHDYNVQLAIEPINRYETDLINTIEEGLELIDNIGAPNLGLLLDTFHMNIEEPIIEKSIQKCRNKIFHIHVADSNRWYPGAGHLDFHSILVALKNTGYNRWISGEFMPLPNSDEAAKKGIRHLTKIWSQIGNNI